MEIVYVIVAILVWGGYSFVLYRRQQARAKTLLETPEFIKQVAGLIREGKSEDEVAKILRNTYKLPGLTGQLIYRQVKQRLDSKEQY